MEILQILAVNAKVRREVLRMTQKELADRMGADQGQVSKIENGSLQIGLTTLVKLADALGMEPYQLLKKDGARVSSTELLEAVEKLSEKEQQAIYALVDLLVKK